MPSFSKITENLKNILKDSNTTHPPTHTQTHTHTHTHTHTLALKASNIKKLKEDILTEEVIQRRSVKKMFLENSQNLLENTCAFLNKVAAGTSASL